MVSADYQIQLDYEPAAPAWDAFLAQTPGGHHVQTSLWAQVKALLGWQSVRFTVTWGERIVAGAQVLFRCLPLLGAIGYAPKGPLLAVDTPLVAQLVMRALAQIATAHRIQLLILQPPHHSAPCNDQFPAWGVRQHSITSMPRATVLIDLTQDLDAILAQMKAKTRYNLRLGQRKGMTVREGTEHDLPRFYRLLRMTAQRQHFQPEAEEYYARMWSVFRPHGLIRLFVAEYEDDLVAALLVIPFGDTVLYKRGAWSGQHGSHHPNELLHWTVITWAKAQGYRYYDFEGIDPQAARILIDGGRLPEAAARTVTAFKVGFGGQVRLFPEAHVYIYNPLLRWVYTTVSPLFSRAAAFRYTVNRFRLG